MTWLLTIYLCGMPLGAYVAGEVFDTKHLSRRQVRVLGALIWPVLVYYMLAGFVLMSWEALNKGPK